ncbi:hypothetical protein CRYUN_Cryun03dG0047200 [Craigia yunnanensis]
MIEKESHGAKWNETFRIYCGHLISNIIFTVKFDNPIGATLIGRAYIPVEDVIKGAIVDRWDTNWSQGIRSPVFEGVLALSSVNEKAAGLFYTKMPKKANEGVTVLMLAWDDGTSVEKLKMDVVDSKLPRERSGKRAIVSYVGGIDLWDGRYVLQDHPLFKTLGTIHHEDFHQPNFAGSSIKKGGPRKPWHDIHCKLEGPIAWDVLYNFEQRWQKQVGSDILIPQSKLNEITIQPSTVTSSKDPETWNVQLFRSIVDDLRLAY